ncbi:Alpha/Beta hydrolase protein [Mucor lusitanicus]|uniref:Alpha/Beta hydrolase protein n=1 Tax=Mucor circinelloides f. lusitanicus TaxID=29924 RepID=A0A8H4BTB5_MUCCL|nr:Alpha/Beta hydrolase protein [Mucor lusitanicus]
MKQQPLYAKEDPNHTHHSHHHHQDGSRAGHSRTNSTATNASKKSNGSQHRKLGEKDESGHATTSVSGIPIFIDKKQGHSLLRSLRQQGVPEPGRSRSWPYLGYMVNGFKNLFLTFYFNWTMLFTAPISSAALILVYPTSVTFLVLFEMGLKLFMETWKGAEVVRYISLKYGAPELLLADSSAQLVQKTLPVLGLPATPISVSGCRKRTFDLSIAQTFVLLSSLIYERDTRKVRDAFDLNPALEAQAEGIIESRMKELLWESEARIRQIAESWGLHFAGVSELKSLGGPFCGIFWSETAPFIIVAFKGTTPTNYEEFLVDATFQRTDARSFLFGCVHAGFFESLFATSGFGDQDVRDPYGAILAAVRSKAEQLQERLGTNEPVQLWITGHSLGASLSSLLFARWLKCPSDLGRRLVLRDAYVLGTPAVGDSDFASTFASHANQPVTRASTLFRIINKSDIFSRLPPGYDSRTCGRFMSESDFFNYSHVGHAVQITHNWQSKPLKSFPSSYEAPAQLNIITSTLGDSSSNGSHQVVVHKKLLKQPQQQQSMDEQQAMLPNWAKVFIYKPWLQNYLPNGNPIYFIEKLYPFFIKDHIPKQYFDGLQRARVYYENEESELMNQQNQIIAESLKL